jgi:NAD(P)-dependent dehydrogenase (short-subunit alcohol dehydrogenase family)
MQMASLKGKVVVVTGGSSGIGRAAAVEFARRGARVVVAARRAGALEDTVRLCAEAGGEARAVPTDVTQDADVQRLMQASLAVEGRIDVWVNNAGTTLFAPLDQGPFEDHLRVIDTNLFGAMRCARLLVPVFKRQREGVLINVGSILSKIGQPFSPSYVVSKFGLRGLCETLRTEFSALPEVHVCSFLPYTVATPYFESAANYTGLLPHPLPPVQDPAEVARALVELAEHPQRERHVPRSAWLGLALHAVMPELVERTLLQVLQSWHLGPELAAYDQGALVAPRQHAATVHGTSAPKSDGAHLVGWVVRLLAGRRPPPPAPLGA